MILSIETSLDVCGASVYADDKKYSESILSRERSHASMIAVVIDSALKQYPAGMEDIKTVAVSAGPGSFTGLRIGLSTAKGICFARGIPLCMVPTFEAIALEVASTLPFISQFAVLSRANSTEFFFARYTAADGIYKAADDIQALDEENIKKRLTGEEYLVSGRNWLNVKKYVILSSPKPSFVAAWAEKFGSTVAADEIDLVEPMYLKEFVIKKKVNQ